MGLYILGYITMSLLGIACLFASSHAVLPDRIYMLTSDLFQTVANHTV